MAKAPINEPTNPGRPSKSIRASAGSDKKRVPLVEGVDFSMETLNRSNVPSRKDCARKERKEEGEELFQQMIRLIEVNFPPNQHENEAQYRDYIYDPYSATWFIDVAVGQSGKVIGVSMYAHELEGVILIPDILAVDKDFRRRGIGHALISKMLRESSDRFEKESEVMICDIECPDLSLHGDEAILRNVIRPAFHDNVTRLKAVRLQNGESLLFHLPLLASDTERENAIKEGRPLEPAEFLFAIRPLVGDPDGISSRKAAELLIWLCRDYHSTQIENIKPEEANKLLASSLTRVAPDIDRDRFERMLNAGHDASTIVRLVPETLLPLVKISESGR